MSVTTTAHLNFRGDARAALEFYQSVFGGTVTVATFTDIHAVEDPTQADQVAWGQVAAPSGFHIMAYDVQPSKGYDAGENPFYVSVRGTDDHEVTGFWTKLADGASVLTDLGQAPWGGGLYGMLKDRFGVTWIVDVAPDAG